jgi:ADP-ribose pyrophosphatase YjhB (NUDIX family)
MQLNLIKQEVKFVKVNLIPVKAGVCILFNALSENMGHTYNMQIRVTGILIENGKILLVKQNVDNKRKWSLPGGRVEKGEKLDEALIREINEETGLKVTISKLLYLCEKPEAVSPILHITFMLHKIKGKVKIPSNEYDKNPIFDVKMVPIDNLMDYGFSGKFVNLVKNRFPDAGSYKGYKKNIGL